MKIYMLSLYGSTEITHSSWKFLLIKMIRYEKIDSGVLNSRYKRTVLVGIVAVKKENFISGSLIAII
jgi:hypothetical protein